MNDNLNEKGEKIQLLSRDLDANSDMSLKYRIFNFYYSTLRKKAKKKSKTTRNLKR